MFAKRPKEQRIVTVIGQGTRIQGDVEFHGGLHLDGEVRGMVCGAGDEPASLTVSEHGRIEGDVKVAHLILNGAVVGDVEVTGRAELAPAARVKGTLYYSLLEMAMGAEVNGQLVHRSASTGEALPATSELPREDAD
jgi:cytoskeletal protein CcmA (bactofilin family)